MNCNVKNALTYYQCEGHFIDFLYSHKLSWEERKECVLSLKSFIGKPFFLSRLYGDSETLQYLSGQFEILSTGEAVNIELSSDY